VKRVWDAVRSVRAKSAVPVAGFGGAAPTSGTLDAAALAAAIGSTPAVQGSVVKFTIGREVRMHGVTSSAAMGVNTWAAFSGSDAHASVDGDVVMTAVEVQPVLRALRKAEIAVVALHNHMLEEDPRLLTALDAAVARADATPGHGHSAEELRARVGQWTSK
jgi:hypothetical protein